MYLKLLAQFVSRKNSSDLHGLKSIQQLAQFRHRAFRINM
jgi:hypothetical protein